MRFLVCTVVTQLAYKIEQIEKHNFGLVNTASNLTLNSQVSVPNNFNVIPVLSMTNCNSNEPQKDRTYSTILKRNKNISSNEKWYTPPSTDKHLLKLGMKMTPTKCSKN